MSLLENFPHRVTHQTPTYTQSAVGGDREVMTSITTNIEAWVQAASHTEVEEYARRDQTITHKVLLLPDDTGAMTVGDRLVVASGPSFVGDSLEIRSIGEQSAGLDWVHTAMVELIPQ